MIPQGRLKRPRTGLVDSDATTFANTSGHGRTLVRPSESALPEKVFYRVDDRGAMCCVYCDCKLFCWTPGDDLWVEHARWYPTCGFVNLMKGEQFVLQCQQLQETFLRDAQVRPLSRISGRDEAVSSVRLSDYLEATLDAMLNTEDVQFYLKQGVPKELVLTTLRRVLLTDQDRLRRDGRAALSAVLRLHGSNETGAQQITQTTHGLRSDAQNVVGQSSDDATLLSKLDVRLSEAEDLLRLAKARLRENAAERTRKGSAHASEPERLNSQARLDSDEAPPCGNDVACVGEKRLREETETCAITSRPSPTENVEGDQSEKQTETGPKEQSHQGDELSSAGAMEIKDAQQNGRDNLESGEQFGQSKVRCV
ncbi:baculoviral IAP repeat-containing protein 2-like [Tropilaelaps mercedesae]|uniref:Baculoviral IAP repeat-containing protein 2-like n=1 Tax=Tropilaelaps mercedesae TaxID=418985 RepID=A0A1V9XAU1_9ACAR|nr:baculoviral IAP repeat-containing protein 2-like [Tropilaelaps mercedesae]